MIVNQDPYLEYVENKAIEKGKLFMLDSGEGRDFIDPVTGWEIEDLSGWLIDVDDKKIFLASKSNKTAYTDFSDDYIFVIWEKTDSGELKVEFKKY